MPLSSSVQIDVARQLLRRFSEFMNTASFPRDMDNFSSHKKSTKGSTRELLRKLKDLTDETIQKLESPTLRLAFIGATSSGKSTLVNALLGHAIVPTEAGEMSAGIVKIFNENRDDCELTIQRPISSTTEPLPDDIWQGVDRLATTDQDAYARLHEVMLKYHEIKSLYTNIVAPDVEIKTRNMLICGDNWLPLPPGVNLEIVDLPGIREINDAVNLSVVQESLKRSVLVVVLNYEDTTTGRLEALLSEVSQVIETFKSANTVFFVLNKVDRWNEGDMPLDQRLASLRRDIAQRVNMNEEDVVVSPIKALQLFLYRAAYGAAGVQNLTDRQIIYLATALVKAGVIDAVFEENEALENAAQNKHLQAIAQLAEALGKNVDPRNGNPLTPELQEKLQERLTQKLQDFRKDALTTFLAPEIRDEFLERAKTQSYGDRLIASLTQRIENHFPQLVIQPTVYEWQVLAQETLNQVKGDAAVILKAAKDGVERLIQELKNTSEKLQKTLKNIQDDLTESFNQFTEGLETANLAQLDQAVAELRNHEFLASFTRTSSVLSGIKKKASNELFENVVAAYLKGELAANTMTLAQELKKLGCATREAGEFAKILEKIREFYQEYPSGEVRLNQNYHQRSELKKYEELFDSAGLKMTELLCGFFEYQLQAKVTDFEKIMRDATAKIRDKMYRVVAEECGLGEEVANGIVPADDYIAQAIPVKFEDARLPFPPATAQIMKDTKTWKEERKIKQGFFARLFRRPQKTETITHTTDYWVLKQPSRSRLVETWDGVTANAIPGMIGGLADWFNKNCQGIINFFKEQIEDAIERYKRYAGAQIKRRQEETDAVIKEWTNFIKTCENSLPLNKMTQLIETGRTEEK